LESLFLESFDEDFSRVDEELEDVDDADEFVKLLFAELVELSFPSLSLLDVDLLKLLLCFSL